MNFRDRSPNRMGQGQADNDAGVGEFGGGGNRGRGGRNRFRGFRGGFRRGDDRNNTNERPNPWKDVNDDRFDNKNTGGFRGGVGSFGSFNDNRDLQKNIRDFGPHKDLNRPLGGGNARLSQPEQIKWNDSSLTPKPAPAAVAVSQNTLVGHRTNDVELIVTHKMLTEYAEFIERRLKSGGFNVDLLFPNEEVPLGRVLGNIASRGTLYALVVTQLSEEHRSVTVNILYGQTQEHRNMPLDDALNMIGKNFEAFTRGDRAPVVPPPGAVPVTPAGIPLGEKHPEFIQSLFNILVENRPLTGLQYEKLMGYLQEKKDRLFKNDFNHNSSVPKPADETPQNTKACLQNRILNMLGKNKLSTQQTLFNNTSSLKNLQSIVQNKLLGPPALRFN